MIWISVRGSPPRRIKSGEFVAVRPARDADVIRALEDSPWERSLRESQQQRIVTDEGIVMKICVASSTYPPAPSEDEPARAPRESTPELARITEFASQVRVRAVARNSVVQTSIRNRAAR